MASGSGKHDKPFSPFMVVCHATVCIFLIYVAAISFKDGNIIRQRVADTPAADAPLEALFVIALLIFGVWALRLRPILQEFRKLDKHSEDQR